MFSNKYEFALIELKILGKVIAIATLYVPPHSNITDSEEMLSNFSNKYEDFILMGDLNCNMLSVSSSQNLINICNRNNLHIHHNNLPTHYDTFHGSQSILDVFLLSKKDNIIVSKQLYISPSISKHSLISICYDITVPKIEKSFTYRNFKNINVDELLSYATRLDLEMILQTSDVDIQLDIINSNLLHLLNKFAPIVTIKRKKSSKFPFMNNPEMIQAKTTRDLAFKAYKEDGLNQPQKWLTYCCYRNRVTKMIKKAKKDYAEQIFNPNQSSKVIWEKIRDAGVPSKKSDSTNISLDVNLMNIHFSRTPDLNIFVPSLSPINEHSSSFSFRNIDLEEFYNF